jgi:hypothetical protein
MRRVAGLSRAERLAMVFVTSSDIDCPIMHQIELGVSTAQFLCSHKHFHFRVLCNPNVCPVVFLFHSLIFQVVWKCFLLVLSCCVGMRQDGSTVEKQTTLRED